jgi:hypothetical protein
MRLWESNSRPRLDYLRSADTGQSSVTTQENPHHRGHWEHRGAQGESHPIPHSNRLQFLFHDRRGSFFCED